MRQEINLYQKAEKVRPIGFGGIRLAQAVVAVLVVLVLASAALVMDGRAQRERVAALEQAKQAATQRLTALAKRLPAPQADAVLVERVRTQERLLASHRLLLDRLATDKLGQAHGFSPWMRALSRRPHQDLWLEGFEFGGDSGPAFHGRARDPRAVPRFLASLAAESAFAGHRFRTLRIERDEDGSEIEFTLRSAGAEK